MRIPIKTFSVGQPKPRHFQICVCTDKKENEILLIYKETKMGSLAKSCMRKGFLIYEETRKYLTIYEETVSHV
jgi:hypothetical protein